MKTAILKSDNDSSLRELMRHAKKIGVMIQLISDEEIEDFLLGKLIDKADKEKGGGKIKDPIQFLKKHGAPL